MLLADADDPGVSIELVPTGYEFPAKADSLDGNWLVVAGRVRSPEGAWGFSDPCMQVDEAQVLGRWLVAVGRGEVAPARQLELDPGQVVFREPNLTFELVERERDSATLRVTFCLEALPPWAPEAVDGVRPPVYIVVRMTLEAVAAAAAAWKAELERFPERGIGERRP